MTTTPTAVHRRWYVKHPVIAASVVAGALALSGTAYAYWSTTGTGAGTGTSSASTSIVTLTGTIAPGLAPGLSRTVTFTANNPGDTAAKIGTVTFASISSADGEGVGCNVPTLLDDFTMAQFNANQVIPAVTAAAAVTATGTLVYANDSLNSQDECKGDVMTLLVTVGAGV
ncbi:MAG TPA: hypothetical protein VK453_05420 [Micromonosporaceae bacterium]|nr:hypothetical protein [Micromonosporaceae bacterium]